MFRAHVWLELTFILIHTFMLNKATYATPTAYEDSIVNTDVSIKSTKLTKVSETIHAHTFNGVTDKNLRGFAIIH